MNWKFLHPKLKFVLLFIGLIGSTFILDRLIFVSLFFQIPNEMEWDSSPWYNFLHKSYSLKKEKGAHRTIITGSSVALYSALPESLTQNLNGKSTVDFYSHVAMAPSDLYYYKSDLLETNPDLILYLFNFADLQWEYLKPVGSKLVFDETTWRNEFSDRFPARVVYPKDYLVDHWSLLGKKTITKLITKSLFYVNRYRVFFWDPIAEYLDNHFRSGRKYHIYQGEKPLESIWSKGWTKTKATIECKTQNQLESVFVQKRNTEVRFRFSNSKENLEKGAFESVKVFSKSGWNDLDWKEIAPKDFPWVWVQLEVLTNIPTAREVGLLRNGTDENVGLRLAHYFCKTPKFGGVSYLRQSFWDDTRFLTMTEPGYDKDYFERMVRDSGNRHELWRLHVLREAKKKISSIDYHSWKELERVYQISDYYYKNNIPFVFVLTPENPLEFSIYKDTEWRKRWVAEVKNHLTRNNQQFVDYTEIIKDKRLFFDPHHLTYEGAKDLEPHLLKTISNSMIKN
ncbi:hypothetical protein P3G55_08205 [Leptospira sp. 96542]|nr:hypothetical protein [Leptospira sp. 96542]